MKSEDILIAVGIVSILVFMCVVTISTTETRKAEIQLEIAKLQANGNTIK